MLKNNKCRMLATVFGGFALLAGAGTVGTAMAAKFQATLTGSNVASGDSDGWGRVRIHVNDETKKVCADVEVRSVGKVTAVQIFRGAEGEAGDPVVKLDRPDDDDSEDCDTIGRQLADDIQANPAGFYALVQTVEHPNGAIRGQFGPSAN